MIDKWIEIFEIGAPDALRIKNLFAEKLLAVCSLTKQLKTRNSPLKRVSTKKANASAAKAMSPYRSIE